MITTITYHALGTKVDLLPDIDHEYHLREGDISQIFLASFFLGNISIYTVATITHPAEKDEKEVFYICILFNFWIIAVFPEIHWNYCIRLHNSQNIWRNRTPISLLDRFQ